MNNNTLEQVKYYLVEINQAENEIIEYGEVKFSEGTYNYLLSVVKLEEDSNEQIYYYGEKPYVIRKIGKDTYRFDYKTNTDSWYMNLVFMVNVGIVLISILLIGVLIYIWMRIIKPFNQIVEMPYMLSKGNLTIGVEQQKQKYFGDFLWGLDLLRDKLEYQKKAEIKLQKEKKTLVLSISHDIKTPLSAIKLYVKALNENLYKDKNKQNEIVNDIGVKAEEIENFVSQIVKASKEDFLKLEVEEKQFYLSELMNWIQSYYSKKLDLLKIGFQMEEYTDSLLTGDLVRLEEVLQNIIENAIKYGDGEEILIRFATEENCCLISILNTGCELKKDELPHIFDGFWRGSNVGRNDGSGLGLYICRELIRKMKGSIFAEIKEKRMCVTVVVRML
jgi:signal transduction histidine kinase